MPPIKSSPRLASPTSRIGYGVASLAVFFSQHLLLLVLVLATKNRMPPLPWWFWFNPFRLLVSPDLPLSGGEPGLLPTLGMATILVADIALVWLAFTRANVLSRRAWVAALTMVPFLQLPAIGWLTLAPEDHSAPSASKQKSRLDLKIVVTSILSGVGLIVGTVVISTLVFGLYGWILFLASPLLIAMAVGYLANRKGDVGFGHTLTLVLASFVLGGATLMGFAIEGLLCLLMATPLVAVVGLIGASLGFGLATLGRRGRGTTLSSVAFIPILLAAEAVLPPHATFESVESVEVAAPSAAVWDSIVHMGPIPDAPAAPFRWGLAYPVRGEILGTGVGSIRRGVFSTGIAFERVTEWDPDRELDFVVLSDPPALHEFSPYVHVNSPHVSGYFRTLDARFTLTALSNGRTRLTLKTRHELDLEPALYWTPLAQLAVHANKIRVLAHFKQQAESRWSSR